MAPKSLLKKWDKDLAAAGKQLHFSGAGGVVQLIIAVVIKLPLLFVLFVIVPLNLLFDKMTQSSGNKSKKSSKRNSTRLNLDEPTTEEMDKASRKYDIVLFGATGYTGGLAVKYISKQYGDKISWAIAGRSEKKLKKIYDGVVAKYPSLEGKLGIIQADSGNPESIVEMVKCTRAVCTTVGPFSKYGMPLVEACAVYGTGYSDITGETDFARKTIYEFDDMARKSGATIVHFCGNDCVPWDLLTLVAANQLSEKGAEIREIHHFDEANGSPSGGTVDTILMTINGEGLPRVNMGFDPLLKLEDGSKSTSVTIPKVRMKPGYDSWRAKFVGMFPLAPVNADCVRRSNAVLKYSDKLVYTEASVYPGFSAAVVNNVNMVLFGCFVVSSWLRPLAFKMGVLPHPGEGPSEDALDAGFLRVIAHAKGVRKDDGKTVKFTGSIWYPTDPGYRDTARMVVEAALTIALDKENKCVPGVTTPAVGLGMPYLDRLVDTGCKIEVVECK